MTIDETNRQWLCRTIGDPAGALDDTVAVFKTDELTEIWDSVAAASNTFVRRRAAVAVMFERLLNSATKLHDYTAGETGEKMSQVTSNLEKRYKNYELYLLDVLQPAKASLRLIGLRARPRQGRVGPDGD